MLAGRVMQKTMLNEKVMLLKLSILNPTEINFTSGQFLNIKIQHLMKNQRFYVLRNQKIKKQ